MRRRSKEVCVDANIAIIRRRCTEGEGSLRHVYAIEQSGEHEALSTLTLHTCHELVAQRLARRVNAEMRQALEASQQHEAARLQRLTELEEEFQSALQRLMQVRRR